VDEAVATGSRLPPPPGDAPVEAQARLPLNQPFPSDVFVSAAGSLAAYRCYPTFSAQWFWRRTAIFGPAAAAVGALQSLLLALQFHDNQLGLLCAAVGMPIWLAIVTTGPALATLVRHRRFPLNVERVAVVIAILLGLAVSCTGASGTPPPLWQVLGSMLAVWFAAKIFKIGLLMQGKPPNLATLVRWARLA
jgi:hypothetical protein